MLYVLFIYTEDECKVLDFSSLRNLMMVRSDMENKGHFCSQTMVKVA